jgi:hypothetical protein
VRVHDRLPTRSTTVEEDWRAWLPPEKSQVFGAYVQQLECRYSMFSVTLNEAFELRRAGLLAKSYQALCVSQALCARLADPLSALLGAFSEHASHYGTAPNAAPLDPANFQSTRGQSCARMNNLLSRILLTQRAHFLHKIGDLQELVEDLGRDFCRSAEELATGVAGDAARLWEATNAAHFDLNTCLRESFVLLKSFLRAIPGEQLSAFECLLTTHMNTPCPKPAARQPVIRHRRMPQFAGE